MNEKHQTVTPRLLAMSPHRFWYFETALHPFRGDIFLTDPIPVFFTHTVTFIATTPSTKPHPRGVVSHPRELSLSHVGARRTPHPLSPSRIPPSTGGMPGKLHTPPFPAPPPKQRCSSGASYLSAALSRVGGEEGARPRVCPGGEVGGGSAPAP